MFDSATHARAMPAGSRFIDLTALDSDRLRALRFLAFLIIPAGILSYYIIFSFTYYVGGLLAFAGVALLTSPGTSIPYKAVVPGVALYAWWVFSVTWSPYVEAAFWVALTGVYVTYLLLAAPIKVRFGDLFALQLMMLCGMAWASCALISYYEVGAFIDETKGSVRSTYGAFFLASLPASLFLAIQRRSLLAIAVLILTLAIGVQLASRTFLLLSLPALLGTMMVTFRDSEVFRLVRWPLLLLVGVVGAAIFVEAAAFSGSDLFETIGRGTSFQIDETVFAEARTPWLASEDLVRRLLVVVGLDSFRESPIFGAGFMSTPFYLGQYYTVEQSAHGLPLFLLGETGLIGTALFFWLLLTSVLGYVLHARRMTGEAATIAYVELTTLCIVLANGMFHQVYFDFYFYLFLGIGLWRLKQARDLARQLRSASVVWSGYSPSVGIR